MKYKSTLTVMSGFVVLITVACITFPKLGDNEPKPAAKFSKMEVKTRHHEKTVADTEKNIPIHFGLNANFGQKPESEQ